MEGKVKMTEQEIINILKENKTKGVAYLFMPEEVSEWVWKHLTEPRLLYLNPRGDWEEFNARCTDDYEYENVVFALPDDYKVKEGQKLNKSEKYVKLSDILRLVTESFCDLESISDKGMFIEDISKLETKEIKE